MNEPTDDPLAYFITFSCYGARVRGDSRGSVDGENNQHGQPFVAANKRRNYANRKRMKHTSYELNAAARTCVLDAIEEVCRKRGWKILAAHVRTCHVHTVVSAPVPPERVMSALKAYASFKLNQSGLEEAGLKRWSRHGSTVYLWTPGMVDHVIEYVVYQQGAPMAVFAAPRQGAAPCGRGTDLSAVD